MKGLASATVTCVMLSEWPVELRTSSEAEFNSFVVNAGSVTFNDKDSNASNSDSTCVL